MTKKLSLGRYDYAACMTFTVYAMCSIIIPMCLVPLAVDLGFPLDDGGMSLGGVLQLGRAIPMVIAMAACGFIAGRWGKRRVLGFSLLLMAFGIMACSLSPLYGVLMVALAVSGLGEGVVEGLATPYIQDLHPDEPGRYLNFSHSFWSVGVVLTVLAAGGLLYAGVSWRVLIFATGFLALIPVFIYLLPGKDGAKDHDEPMHWREVCAKTKEIVKIRRFWLFFAAMFFAGGGEFCLTFWCASFIQLEYGGSAWIAGAGTACFAAGMFLGRLASGYLVRQNRLKALIVGMGAVSTVICLFFPMLNSVWLLLILLFLSGIAVGPFWPSIQSDGAVRVKGDYTMMMILYSCAGVPGCGVFTSVMGILGDYVGLRMSFYVVPLCFVVVTALMGYEWLTERRERKATTRESASLRPAAK